MTPTIEDELDGIFDAPFLFRDSPGPAPSDLRPIWRVPVVLLLVRACRQEQATHEQLHVLNWAVRSATSAAVLSTFLAGQLAPEQAIVRFEPALDRAVALARGFELLEWKGRYWTLTERGRETLEEIDSEHSLLAGEKALLDVLPKPLTQTAVDTLLRRGTT